MFAWKVRERLPEQYLFTTFDHGDQRKEVVTDYFQCVIFMCVCVCLCVGGKGDIYSHLVCTLFFPLFFQEIIHRWLWNID